MGEVKPMDEVIRLRDGTLRVPAYVEPGEHGPVCGLAVHEIGPDHPDYARYADHAVDEGAAPDADATNERFAAREAAEAHRTVAICQPDGRLLLPTTEWARGVYELTAGEPGYEAWAATAITEAQWERQWWPPARRHPHRRSA